MRGRPRQAEKVEVLIHRTGVPRSALSQSALVRLNAPSVAPGSQKHQARIEIPAAAVAFFAMVIVLDNPTSTLATRQIPGWEPTHPGRLEDFDHGDYF